MNRGMCVGVVNKQAHCAVVALGCVSVQQIGCSCVAVTPFGDTQQWSADWLFLCCCYSGDTQQWSADWLFLCCCYSVWRHAAVEC
jgi:hypothetical protein